MLDGFGAVCNANATLLVSRVTALLARAPHVTRVLVATDDFKSRCFRGLAAALGEAPRASSSATTSSCPHRAARASAVAPSPLTASIGAPASSSIATDCAWPYAAARCSALLPDCGWERGRSAAGPWRARTRGRTSGGWRRA